MYIHITPTEFSALEVLRQTGICPLQAALIAARALKANRKSIRNTEHCLSLGLAALKSERYSVPFAEAATAALAERKHLRPRTLSDMRYILRRIMKYSPELAERSVRSLTATECDKQLSKAFPSIRQYHKARLVLSSLFSTAQRKGWCSINPAADIKPPRIIENRIHILSPHEIRTLLRTAAEYHGGICLPAVAIMLYAGIRPNETERLTWAQIDLINGFISLHPQHSKTGGARRVTIHPPLSRILSRQTLRHGSICPSGWRNHWASLHRLSGWDTSHPWQADILRHTYATYHLLYFKSYELLQWETGHRDASLLRTRYVDMSLAGDSHAFWHDDFI